MFKNTIKRVHSGFTLAEVLITLGIIGVVAAMTMPTLMNATNGAQYKTAYKKALSVISQAVVLNLALDDYDLGTTTQTGTEGSSMFALLKNRTNIVRTETGAIDGYSALLGSDATSQSTGAENVADTNYTVFFNDGIMFTYAPGTSTYCTNADGAQYKICTGFIDVNGVKAPNRLVQCDNSDATATKCEIKNPTDVYPVMFYDQTVLPNSVPARAVLYSK